MRGILFIDPARMIKGEGGQSGSPLLHSGLVARDRLRRVHTPTEAVHTLKVGVAERNEGRYPPGGIEGEELLQVGERKYKEDHMRRLINECITEKCMVGMYRMVYPFEARRGSYHPPLRGPVLARPCLGPSPLWASGAGM